MAGIAASLVLSAVHGLASITFRGNQLISGVALNFLAAGITVLIAQAWFAQGGRTPSLEGGARFAPLEWPLTGVLDGIPVLGPVYAEIVSGHTILVYVAMAAVPISWWVLYRTRFGLRLRAVGENPAAVDTAGISVVRLRYAAVAICGVLTGLAGAYLATGLAAGLPTDIVLRSWRGQTRPGRVLRVEPLADTVTEETLAKIVFDAAPSPLPPVGELAEVTVQLPPLPAAPTIPNASICTVSGRRGVWKLTDGRLEFRPLVLGRSDLDGLVQVEQGLAAGDQVVVYSEKALTTRSRIHVVERMPGVAP